MESDKSSQNAITVSVCMITYNHEAYIAQAIEGVLMQQTDFPVELIIGEDCSTDHTREIVQTYATRYPGRIRALLNDHNLGPQYNFVATLKECRGKYVALCEGDDFWTDPHKLQKQVDFMETHPDYAMCFHLTYKLYEATGEIVLDKGKSKKNSYNINDVINSRCIIYTTSVLFRNWLIQELPLWFSESPVGDTPLFILLAQYGKIGLIKQPMAVYRIHPKGLWQGADDIARLRMTSKTFSLVSMHLGPNYEKLFRNLFSKLYLSEAKICISRGDAINAKKWLKKSLQSSFFTNSRWIDQVVMIGRLYLPQLYKFAKWLQERVE